MDDGQGNIWDYLYCEVYYTNEPDPIKLTPNPGNGSIGGGGTWGGPKIPEYIPDPVLGETCMNTLRSASYNVKIEYWRVDANNNPAIIVEYPGFIPNNATGILVNGLGDGEYEATITLRSEECMDCCVNGYPINGRTEIILRPNLELKVDSQGRIFIPIVLTNTMADKKCFDKAFCNPIIFPPLPDGGQFFP